MKIKRIILFFSFFVPLMIFFGCKETINGFWHLKFGTWKVDEFVGKEFSQFVKELEHDEDGMMMQVGASMPWGVGRALNDDEDAFIYQEGGVYPWFVEARNLGLFITRKKEDKDIIVEVYRYVELDSL